MTAISTQISSAATSANPTISSPIVADAAPKTTVVQSNNNSQSTPSVAPVQGTSVSLSGQALMLSRLFNTTDPNATPPVVPGTYKDTIHMIMSPQSFLTKSDRVLLSNMYGFAQQQGADLQYVDAIAYALGSYRQANNGADMISYNSAVFDLAGHKMTVNFNAQDTATAASIQNGSAINSTQIDHGFLRYTLNPGFGALTYTGSMQFLQQMVTKFSGDGTANMTLPSQFSTYTPASLNDKAVFTASKEVVLKPVVDDFTYINGIVHWRTPELAAAAAASPGGMDPSAASLNVITVNKLLGNVQPKTTTKESQMMTLLDLMFKSNTKN